MLDVKLPSVGVFDARSDSASGPATVARRLLSYVQGADGLSFSGQRILLNPNPRWLGRPDFAGLVIEIAAALRRGGAVSVEVYTGPDERAFQDSEVRRRSPLPARRKTARLDLGGHVYRLPKLLSETDLLINVSGLFADPRARLAGAIYNMASLLQHREADRSFLEALDPELFNTTLVDVAARVVPDVNIVYLRHDAANGSEPPQWLVSSDIVAVDALAATLAGFDPQEIPALRLASESGLGIGWVEAFRIDGDRPRRLRTGRGGSSAGHADAGWSERVLSTPSSDRLSHVPLVAPTPRGVRPVRVTYCANTKLPHTLAVTAFCVGEARCDRCSHCLGKCPFPVN